MEPADEQELLLLELNADILRHIFSLCGPLGAARAAATCSALARLHRELVAARGTFYAASALVELENGGETEAAYRYAAGAAAEATRLALFRLPGVCVHAAFVGVALPDGSTPDLYPLVLHAVSSLLPEGVQVLLVSTSAVAGPGVAGAVETDSGIVVLLLACPPGVTPRLSGDGPFPRTVDDARTWLSPCLPPADEKLLWSALFWGRERVRNMGVSPTPVAAWPGAAWVGGVAGGTARGPGVVLTCARPAPVQQPPAAALSLFASHPAAARRGAHAAALSTRGLRRFSPSSYAITHIESLDTHANATLIVPTDPVELTAAERSWLSANHGEPGLVEAHSLVGELFTAVHHRISVYAKLWVVAEDGSELDTLASMAAATECDVNLDTDMRVSVFCDRAFFEAPLVRAALAERRLRCATFFLSEDTSVREFTRATAQLARALAPGAAVLAAACSGRGDELYKEHAFEAEQLQAAFPNAFVSVVVNGELGAPAGLGVGGGKACLQTFTTTCAAVGGIL